jgi:hypothetical protein
MLETLCVLNDPTVTEDIAGQACIFDGDTLVTGSGFGRPCGTNLATSENISLSSAAFIIDLEFPRSD